MIVIYEFGKGGGSLRRAASTSASVILMSILARTWYIHMDAKA
jgi:hypothetical protein